MVIMPMRHKDSWRAWTVVQRVKDDFDVVMLD